MSRRPILPLLACWLLAASCAAPAHVTLVSWNVHHGRGLDGEVDVARLAAELRSLEPDVVALQEVDVGVARSGRVDLAAALGEALGMHHAFGKNIDYQGGDYGNAILSRFPITAQENHHYRMLRAGEQRGALAARVAAPFGDLLVLATHLDYRPDDAERLSCIDELSRLAAARAAALVVACGDFNDTPGSAVHAAASEAFDDAWLRLENAGKGWTYPSREPRKRIDWVLLDRRTPWRVVSARVVETDASDHAILVVELVSDGSDSGIRRP